MTAHRRLDAKSSSRSCDSKGQSHAPAADWVASWPKGLWQGSCGRHVCAERCCLLGRRSSTRKAWACESETGCLHWRTCSRAPGLHAAVSLPRVRSRCSNRRVGRVGRVHNLGSRPHRRRSWDVCATGQLAKANALSLQNGSTDDIGHRHQPRWCRSCRPPAEDFRRRSIPGKCGETAASRRWSW